MAGPLHFSFDVSDYHQGVDTREPTTQGVPLVCVAAKIHVRQMGCGLLLDLGRRESSPPMALRAADDWIA